MEEYDRESLLAVLGIHIKCCSCSDAKNTERTEEGKGHIADDHAEFPGVKHGF